MEQWITTRDTRLAAGFGTIGMIVRVNNTLDERSGQELVRFSISLTDVDGKQKTGPMKAAYKSGAMEQKQPDHPLLTILRTFHNRDMLLDCGNKGTMIDLVQVPGTDIWQYVPGHSGLPGVKRGQAVVKTGDLKMVAAFGTVGLRVLKIEGPQGNRIYWVDGARIGPKGTVDGAELMMAWRRDRESVPWSNPFAQGMRGGCTRERVLDAVRECERKILIRPGKGIKSALISEQATDKAWVEVKRFFGA